MENRRAYIRKAFQSYVNNKNSLFWAQEELKALPIPGQSGLDYSKESVSSGGGNGVEGQFAQYVEKRQSLIYKITMLEHQIAIVHKTFEHFRIESKAKGKNHYNYMCVRWLQRRTFRRAAIECGIPESTAIFWIEEIYTVAEAIAEEYELF